MRIRNQRQNELFRTEFEFERVAVKNPELPLEASIYQHALDA